MQTLWGMEQGGFMIALHETSKHGTEHHSSGLRWSHLHLCR